MSTQNKSKLRFLGQLFGALGVMASLVFVAWEIRQNTEAVKSATIHSLSDQGVNLTSMLSQNDELLEAWRVLRDEEELSPEQDLRIRVWYGSALRVQKNRFLQTKLGFLDIETALFIGGNSRAYHRPHFVEFWDEIKANEPKEFVEYMEVHVMQLNSSAE